MARSLCFVFVGVALSGCVLSVPVKPPDFGKFYKITGMLRLPYAEINEPFEAIYSEDLGKSRIDYYGGSVKTYQIAQNGSKYGYNFKIAPMTSDIPGKEMYNVDTCFQSNGTKDAPVSVQSVLPDLKGFKFVRSENCPDISQEAGDSVLRFTRQCDVWQNVNVVGNKKNTYTFWVTAGENGVPVRYEMMGYDSLFGSHYDKYYVDYLFFDKKDKPTPSDFEIPKNMTCGGFPGPGAENRILANPMREFIHNDDIHVFELFNVFRMVHKKQYTDDSEHESRKNIFRQNLRFIHSKNRAGLSYKLKVNHLADRTGSEMKQMRGYRHTPGYNGGQPFHMDEEALKRLPASVDWRLYGAVTPVKDQAVCGSCWSFGTVGTVEGAHFLKTGQLVRLSQQELMDCSWGEGNNGCDGGEDFRSYQWIQRNGGLASEESYGPYLAQDGKCGSKKANKVAVIKGYVNVTSGDSDALKLAIAQNGPISVAIDASHRSLSFYSNGVYYEPTCGNLPDDLDHAVLAVGYGVMNGKGYWLIKNSWSTYWGNDGYVLMAQKDNNCGVATTPTYVVM